MQFEKQDYQEECVKNIIEALKDFDFKNPSKESLKQSLTTFYQNLGKNIPDKQQSDNMNIDVLMETGTGKTFTYIKTIFELNKTYGLNKFIIFVPRKAIKLGVKQNINLTKSYFKVDYGKELKVFEYSGDKSISPIKNFIENNNTEPSVLILTNSSIDKVNNVLKQPQELTFFNGSSILLEGLQAINPVIIIDEPHLLKGKKFIEEFKNFKNVFLRFGATFPTEPEHKLSNMVYTLDSISSFQQYLVKKIQVSTIINSNYAIKLKETSPKKNSFKLLYFKNNQEEETTIKVAEDIGEKIGNTTYNGVHCKNIQGNTVYLSNNTKLEVLKQDYTLTEEEQRLLIKDTIKNHFEKEEKLFKKGIKTLSLFFINNISDYRGENPIIKKIFEEEYIKAREEKLKDENICKEYKEYLEKDYKDGKLQVNEGYFSTSTGSKEEQVAQAVDIILNKKEELLSFNTSLRFIFSVWALQEGWDNPNIFNICKLSNTDQETSKRQQVGRGLRLAVNQQGKRLTYNYLNNNEEEFYNINCLDISVSSAENNFIQSLQNEILQESYIIEQSFTHAELKERAILNDRKCNYFINNLENTNIVDFNEEEDKYIIKSSIYNYMQKQENKEILTTILTQQDFNNVLNVFKPLNNNHQQVSNKNIPKQMVQVRKELYNEFKELWETINKKAKIVYKNITQDTLINDITRNFIKFNILEVKIIVTKESINFKNNKIEKITQEQVGNKDFFNNPNLFTNFIFEITKEEKLPFNFVLKLCNKIISNAQGKQNIINNPKQAKQELINIIKKTLHSSIIQNVDYNFTNQVNISNNSLLQDSISHTLLGKYVDNTNTPPTNYLYNTIVYDSEIEKETITTDPKQVDNKTVTVFAKLPKISIPTPFKSYSPDFAYLIQTPQGKKLFLVVEAKGYNNRNDIPQEEQNKIEYAKQFFKQLQNKVGSEIDIKFTTRINKQTLIDLIKV